MLVGLHRRLVLFSCDTERYTHAEFPSPDRLVVDAELTSRALDVSAVQLEGRERLGDLGVGVASQSLPVLAHAHFEDGGAVGWVTHALAVSEAGRIEHDGATRDSLVLMAGSEEDGAVVAAEMSCEGEMAALAAALTKWDMLLTAVWAVFHETMLSL